MSSLSAPHLHRRPTWHGHRVAAGLVALLAVAALIGILVLAASASTATAVAHPRSGFVPAAARHPRAR